MKHFGSKKLETKRLILKKDTDDDKEVLWKYLFSDKYAVKVCNWVAFKTKEEFLKSKFEIPNNVYIWTIWLKDVNIPIGGISIHHQNDDYYHAEVGYSINPKYWGLGYASEALEVVLDFLINKVGYERISGECRIDNIASKKVMEKCNMKFEGIERKSYYKDGVFYDNYLFSKIKEDYME